MPRKKTDLHKKTLNLRTGDFEKMGELFPELGGSKAIRTLVSKFVDKNYTPSEPPADLNLPDIQ